MASVLIVFIKLDTAGKTVGNMSTHLVDAATTTTGDPVLSGVLFLRLKMSVGMWLVF